MEKDGKVIRASKFYRDEDGHYWENRGVFGGKSLHFPSPTIITFYAQQSSRPLKQSYPNLRFWEEYYGEYEED